MDGSRSLISNFLSSTERHSSRNSLWAEGRYVSYDELLRRAARIANVIVNMLPDNDEKQCAVFVYRTITAYAALLGAQMAGMAYVPLNPKFPVQRTSHMLNVCLADVIVIDRYCLPYARDVLSAHRRPLLVILPDCDAPPDWSYEMSEHRFVAAPEMNQDDYPRDSLPGSDDLAYIVFTSGSTGAPKGVAITHGNAVSYSDNIIRRHQPGCGDRFTQLPDFTFDLSVHDLVVPWAVGACLYCVPEDELMVPDRFVRQHRLTYWTSVPSAVGFLNRFNKLKSGAFESLRTSMFCGEPLPTSLAKAWSAAAPNSIVDNLYGPTEATVAFTGYTFHEDCERAIVPIGEPFPDQEIIICDENLNVVESGSKGELLLGGSQVSNGYWKALSLTEEKFVSLSVPGMTSTRWYRTGDLVEWHEGTGLIYCGRRDHQVKIRGYRVEIQEVEVVMRQISGSDMVAVVPWPLDPDGAAEGLVAFIQGAVADKKSMKKQCADILAAYMIPRKIIDIEEMPVNSSGKIDYKRLVEICSRKK